MDGHQLDLIAKALGATGPRRGVLAGLLSLVLAGSLGRATVTAKSKRQHRARRRVKAQDDTPKPNGKKCNKDAQCLSRNCVGATARGATGRCQCLSTCVGKACGADNGCGSKCQTGSCADATCQTCSAGMCVNATGSCTTAGGTSGTCDQGTCQPTCVPAGGGCTGAGQCCGNHVCNICYTCNSGFCATCISATNKCDPDVGGCCPNLVCKSVTLPSGTVLNMCSA
jgi:hypothetical protein